MNPIIKFILIKAWSELFWNVAFLQFKFGRLLWGFGQKIIHDAEIQMNAVNKIVEKFNDEYD